MHQTYKKIHHLLSQVASLNLRDHPEHDDEFSYQYLSDGLTNENYKITIARQHDLAIGQVIDQEQNFVLRIFNPDSKRLGIERTQERDVMSRVSKLKLSSDVIFDADDFRLSQWQEGSVWTADNFGTKVNINRLVNAIKSLHGLDHGGLVKMDFLLRISHYKEMISQRHGALPAIESRLFKQATNIINTKSSNLSCLCHNDLVAANILETKSTTQSSLTFLDWEYAAINDPLFELAVICQGNNFSSSQRQYLLSAYFGDNSYQFIEHLNYWCWLYDYLSLLWGIAILPADLSLPQDVELSCQKLFDRID